MVIMIAKFYLLEETFSSQFILQVGKCFVWLGVFLPFKKVMRPANKYTMFSYLIFISKVDVIKSYCLGFNSSLDTWKMNIKNSRKRTTIQRAILKGTF